MKEQGTLPEMQKLAEQVGEFIHYWGFKRVHGRIWSHLFLANRPLDAADLVRQMKISKALVSISLRELLDFNVIQEVGKSDRGTHLYRTNPDIVSVITSVLQQRERRMLAQIQAASQALIQSPKEDREKHELSETQMEQLERLIGSATSGLENVMSLRPVHFDDWQKSFSSSSGEGGGNSGSSSSREESESDSHQMSSRFGGASARMSAPGRDGDVIPLLVKGSVSF